MKAVLKPLCSDVELAEVIGLSDRHVRRLAKEGVLVMTGKGVFDTVKSIRAFIEYKANGEGSGGSDEYEQARTRLTLAKAQKAEAETELFQGKLADTDALIALWADRWGKSATKLLAIPNKLAGPLGSETNIAKRQQMLENEITTALNESAAIDQKELIIASLARYGKSPGEAAETEAESME